MHMGLYGNRLSYLLPPNPQTSFTPLSDVIVESNVREVKVHSPDYKGVEADEAITDFLERIK